MSITRESLGHEPDEWEIDALMAERAERAAEPEPDAIEPDLTIEDHGSICIVRGVSDAGQEWLAARVANDGYQPFGDDARLVERRYVGDIINGATAEVGLVVREA